MEANARFGVGTDGAAMFELAECTQAGLHDFMAANTSQMDHEVDATRVVFGRRVIETLRGRETKWRRRTRSIEHGFQTIPLFDMQTMSWWMGVGRDAEARSETLYPRPVACPQAKGRSF